MEHVIKCERFHFNEVVADRKKFEVRNNDRNYKVGDTFIMEEVLFGAPSGRTFGPKTISYVLRDRAIKHGSVRVGIEDGWCVFCWF